MADVGTRRPVMLDEVTAIADRFWRDLAVLAASETPDQRANVIRLALALLGTRLCDQARGLFNAAIEVEVQHVCDLARPVDVAP
jgi:hypothetical protein